MPRIRTVKPEFFRHEDLFYLERDSKLPIRLAFIGLWVVSDREGRFKWKPQNIKLDILPFDDVDFEYILSLLNDSGFIQKYSVNGKDYAFIPSWHNHQLPSRSEPPSEIPAPDGKTTLYDRPPTQTMRLTIYERDNYTCLYCGDNLKEKTRSICLDHVVPYSKNGTNRDINLVTSCKKCNYKKGDKTPDEVGFAWPAGYGERYVNGNYTPVNSGLTYIEPSVNNTLIMDQRTPDKEMVLGIGSKDRVNGIGTVPPSMTKKEFEEFHKKIISDTLFTEPLCMTKGIKNNEDLNRWLYQYDAHIVSENKIEKDYNEYRRHFKNWINGKDTFAPPPIIPTQVVSKLATDDDVNKYRKHNV